jgi:hypothetical protein
MLTETDLVSDIVCLLFYAVYWRTVNNKTDYITEQVHIIFSLSGRNSFSASEAMSCFFMGPKVCYRVHRTHHWPQSTHFHSISFKIHFNIIPTTLRFSLWTLSFRVFYQNPVCIAIPYVQYSPAILFPVNFLILLMFGEVTSHAAFYCAFFFSSLVRPKNFPWVPRALSRILWLPYLYPWPWKRLFCTYQLYKSGRINGKGG